MSSSSPPLSKLPVPSARIEWRAGWRVVAGAAVGVGTGSGLYQYVSSLFIPNLQAEFGWSRGDIATATAVGLIGALSAPLIGRLADRRGILPVIVVCVVAVCLAHLMMSGQTGALWQYMLLAGVLSTAAPGCTSLVYTRAVQGWFDRGRGMALGVVSAGLSLSALLVTPLLEHIIGAYGWRAGYLLLALLAGPIALPIVLATVRSAPPAAIEYPPPASVLPKGGTLRAAIKTRSFWLLALIMVLINAPAGGILTQLAPLLIAKGLPSSAAGLLVALFAGSVLVGRIGIGFLFDRVSPRHVAGFVTAASAVGCLMLLPTHPGLLVAAVAVILVGMMQGAETDVLAYFIARVFGLKAYNSIYGLLFTISLFGIAIGVLGFGELYDLTGSDNAALIAAAVMLAGATLAYFFMPQIRASIESERPDEEASPLDDGPKGSAS